ncbi:hypothetical protein HDU93_007601 [Gonapodya sp. JEL0774]|nr:hypothetical protein HDU93_007601 [Gonapodya sp. JEL0774]
MDPLVPFKKRRLSIAKPDGMVPCEQTSPVEATWENGALDQLVIAASLLERSEVEVGTEYN